VNKRRIEIEVGGKEKGKRDGNTLCKAEKGEKEVHF